MTIKSLLLGSAAAMVATSSLQAADAVVVEPEPVEFVRVCDAYGSGFFFIPGTETCIRFSGFVRSAYEKFSIDGSSSGVAAGGLANVAVPDTFALVDDDFDGVVVFNDDPSLVAQIPDDAGVLVDNPLFNEDAVALGSADAPFVGGGLFQTPGTVFDPDQVAGFQVPDGSQIVGVVATSAAVAPVSFDQDFILWGQRGRLNVDVRSETDYGTLRALYRLEGGQSNVDTNIDMDVALISLAGFRAGFAGANYWSTNHGFGGVNAESVATNAAGLAYPDGFYGFDDATILDYTFAADGLSVTVGIEDPRISYGRDGFGNLTNNGGSGNATGFGTASATNGSDGEVNFYAGFNYSGDFGTLAFTAAHDSLAQEVTAAGISTDTGGFAYKVSLNIDLSELIPGGFIQGWYLNDGDYNTDYVHTAQLLENPEEIYGIAFQANLTDEVEFWANYWNAEGGFGTVETFAGDTFQEGEATQFAVGLNWFPSAAPGFHIKATYFNGDVEDSGSAVLGGLVGVPAGSINADYDGFELSVRRDF